MNLARENDIERLRIAALMLERENQKLAKRTLDLERQNLALLGKSPEELQLRISALEAELAAKRRALFGAKSEKQRSDKSPDRPAAPQTGHGPRAQPQLPIEEVIHQRAGQAPCEKCGGEMGEFAGQFEESDLIERISRAFVVQRHKRQKYKCACGHIETAPGPEKLLEGGRYSINVAVEVAVQKYADHLPLERQAKIMGREGLVIDSQTLWDQIERLAHLLRPLHEALHAHVLSQKVIGIDETHWRLLSAKGRDEGENKRWQAWAVCGENAVSYRIIDSRSAEAAKEVLAQFSGIAMCDGYSVYKKLERERKNFRVANCFAHVRRKFIEAQGDFAAEAGEALAIIGALYAVEREAKETGPPETLAKRRARLREEKSKPLMTQLNHWAMAKRALPQSAIGKAIAYLGEQWVGLQVYLDDPSVEIDNNATERCLRGVVVGRKNHYGSKSRRGTEVAALFYSLIESCKLNGVDPMRYLRDATIAAIRGKLAPLPHQGGVFKESG